MTEEQAIERLKKLDYLLDDVYSTGLIEDEERNQYQYAIETVLSILKEKEKEIQFQKDINKTELDRHKNTEKSLKGIIKKQNRIIDLMADEIANNIINTCPLENYNYDLDCENRCNDNYKECWKLYFENKAKI